MRDFAKMTKTELIAAAKEPDTMTRDELIECIVALFSYMPLTKRAEIIEDVTEKAGEQ